jgi:hypothetical protein
MFDSARRRALASLVIGAQLAWALAPLGAAPRKGALQALQAPRVKSATAREGKAQKTQPARTQTAQRAPSKGTGAIDRVVTEALKLANVKKFPYAAETKGGKLGCAQVVSTALKAAGVMRSTTLVVSGVKRGVKSAGWKEVKPPPKNGDVICWSTYDSTGDGKKDPDTHVGIVIERNGTLYAMNNSSSKRRPVLVALKGYSAPVTSIVRMAGA